MMTPPIYIASAASTTLAVNPLNSYVTIGHAVNVDINVTDVANLTSWQFTLYFLNAVLNCTGITEGPFLPTGGGTFFGKTITNNFNSTHGKLVAYSTLLGTTSVNGSGVLATITFGTLSVGDSPLHLSDTKLGDEKIPPQPIPHTIIDGSVHVQNFTLTVSTVGSGTVALNNTGPYYHFGEAVQLTANPATGWSFDHWSGDLTGPSNPATLIITGNMSATATFTQNQYTLTVTIGGHGSVGKSPDQATYTWGTNVTLTANADIGWTFASWSGDASGTVSPTTVNMTGNKAVTATFTQNVYTLTVTVSPVGSGSVTLNNTGPDYHYGDHVQLNADPNTGWTFDHWSGDLTGPSNPATLTITGNMAVTATFVQINYTLTVSVVGSGTVPLNNTGPYYHYGDAVKLTATPDTDWSFQYWSGDLSGSTSPATIIMTANFSVTAHFLQTPTLQMSPTSKTCRIYNENFTVTITISNAANVEDFKFLIRYNTTLLDYVSVTWNAWGPGTITVDEAGGNITVSNSGAPISGTQTLITINFTTSYYHIWKVAPGWTNDLTDIIFFQWANISYPSGPDLRYERGGSSQINVGPDFAYTFSPIQGDVDNNGIVELFDLRAVAFYFGSKQGDSGWDDASKYDLDGDGTIDVLDLRIIAANYGYTYNP
jgi:uncharacterized repeat protein (TIGR02543 family)